MKGDKRKEQIVQLAIEIVGESGLQGLTIAKLAERAGITEPALYRHFKSKEDIILNTIESIGKRLNLNLARIDSESLKGIKKLSQIFRLNLSHIEDKTGVPKIIYSPEIHSIDLFRNKLYTIIEDYLLKIESIIKSGQKDGSIQKEIQSSTEARRFLSIIQFSAFRYSLSGFDPKIIKEGQKMWTSFVETIRQ